MPTAHPTEFKVKTHNRTYTPAEFDAISRRLQKLEHHMAIIRQTGYLSSVPLQKKLATLEELYNRQGNPFSVHELCDARDVARGTFYNHIFRRADRSKYEEEQAQLMLKVKQVFDDSEQRFGRSVEKYIRFYNEVRPHQVLNYKTLQAFEAAYKSILSESGV